MGCKLSSLRTAPMEPSWATEEPITSTFLVSPSNPDPNFSITLKNSSFRHTPRSSLTSSVSISKKSSKSTGHRLSTGRSFLPCEKERTGSDPRGSFESLSQWEPMPDNGPLLPSARASLSLQGSPTAQPVTMEQWVPLKTDAIQAAKEYQTFIKAKEEEKLAKAERLQMEIIDPIRPLDSFNVSHRAILGRCWDRRAAEQFPINFVHSLFEASKSGTAIPQHCRLSSSATVLHDESINHNNPHSSSNAIPKRTLSRRSHWFATCGIITECLKSSSLPCAASSTSSTFGTHSLRLLNRVDMLNLNTRVLEADSRFRGFGELKSFVAHLMATNSLTDIDLLLFFHTPSKVGKLPNEIREKFFHLITGFMPYCRGIKNNFAFRLCEMVNETDQSTLFLRKQNLKPAYGVQAVRWDRVEVVVPNLNTLVHAIAQIQDDEWISTMLDNLFDQPQLGCSNCRHDGQDAKKSAGPVSSERHFIAEKVNGGFSPRGSRGPKPLYESRCTLQTSDRLPSFTETCRGSSKEAQKRFPEEFILSLMIETLEESYHNIKHLIPSDVAPTGSVSKKEQGDVEGVFSTLSEPLPQIPTRHGEKANLPASCTHNCDDPKAHDKGFTPSQSRFISVVVASFQVFIDPFEWKECHYTRYPIDISANQHSTRSEYGEGVITDIMYGGMLFIECIPVEAAEELQRVLQDMDWRKARSAEGILKDVRKLFASRYTASKDGPKTMQTDKNVVLGEDVKCPEKKHPSPGNFRYRITRRIGGIPMRDSVEIKRISVFFGGDEMFEQTISTPNRLKGGGIQVEENADGTGAASPRPKSWERTNAYSLVASAWMGMETISAVIRTWGIHLLFNPEYAQPLSLFLQKFSGIAPALLQKVLSMDLKMYDEISTRSSLSMLSADNRSLFSGRANGTSAGIFESYANPRPDTAGYCTHHGSRTAFPKSSPCDNPLTGHSEFLYFDRSILSFMGNEFNEADSTKDPNASPDAAMSEETTKKTNSTAGRGGSKHVGRRSSTRKTKPPSPRTVSPCRAPSKVKKKKKINSKKNEKKSNANSVLTPVRKTNSKVGAAALRGSRGKLYCRTTRKSSEIAANNTNGKHHSPMGTRRTESALTISSSTAQTSITYCGTIDVPLAFPGELELVERWNIATLELKAQQNELADLLSSVKATEEAHNALLEDLSVLQRAILPRTTCEELETTLLYLETAIFEPDEIPGRCLCLNHVDWLPRLAAVLTSSENMIRHVQVLTPLTPRDFPKLGMLTGLFYYPSAVASLRYLKFDATNLFGSEAAFAAAAAERNRREALVGLSGKDHKNESDRQSASRSRKGCVNENGVNNAIQLHPGSFNWGSNDFQTMECGFTTENNHGFGVNCPMFYVSPEQALDTLWLLLCAIAENLTSLSPSMSSSFSQELNTDHSFKIHFHQAGRPGTIAQSPSANSEKEDSRHRHQSILGHVSAFWSRSKGSPLHKGKNKHDGETFNDFEDTGPFHLSEKSLLLEPFVSTSVSTESNSSLYPLSHSSGDKEEADKGKERYEDACQGGFHREACFSVVGTSQNAGLSCLYLVAEGENDASGIRKSGEEEPHRRHDSIPGGGGIPLHRHFPRRPTWVHGNVRALELAFFTLPYHHESPLTASPIFPSPLEACWPTFGHYVNPYNSNHNSSRFYLTVQRRIQLQRLLQRTRERCACGQKRAEEPTGGSDAGAATNDESLVRLFGLPDEREEEAILQEQEIQLAAQAEDVWQTLLRIVNSYNHHFNSNGSEWTYSNSPLLGKEHGFGNASTTSNLRNDRQITPCVIILKR